MNKLIGLRQYNVSCLLNQGCSSKFTTLGTFSQGYGSVCTVGLIQKFVPFLYKTVSHLFAHFRAITRF